MALLVLFSPPPTVEAVPLQVLPNPPPMVAKSPWLPILFEAGPLYQLVVPPPPIVAPITLGDTKLIGEPPMTFGAPNAAGSSRKARVPLTFSSSDWLSVVPRKSVPAVVPTLPPNFQKAEESRPS